MIKLKKIIGHLQNDVYTTLEQAFVKSKADNFLYLLQAYRNNELKDAEISEKLNSNTNSFYVLKSRLYDKIQEHLAGDICDNKEEVIKQLQQVPEMCVSQPREVTQGFLLKLEKDMLYYDMHNELLLVYSALKKINLHSEKYFHFSQLYNKHIAFCLSLEKSEELLGNFNRNLAQYHFSRSAKLFETILFLRKAIGEHQALNPSRNIEVIANIMDVQLQIFFNAITDSKAGTEELILQTQKIIQSLPESSSIKCWAPVLDYLFFEYYFKTNQATQALQYFEKVNACRHTLLLYNYICFTTGFLLSKTCFLAETDKTELLKSEYGEELLTDPVDVHARIMFGVYTAMQNYYLKQYKEASTLLNTIINENSFKDYFHMNTEIRLMQAYFYMLQKEYDLADSILTNVYRKIKTENLSTNYIHVLDLIKVFAGDIKKQNDKPTPRQRDYFTLFMARNTGDYRILGWLAHDLKKAYAY